MNFQTGAMEGNQLHLNRMLDSIRQIESYTQGGRQAFLNSKMVQDAVICNLELIGEAAKRLSASAAPIPRERLASLAEKLIDDYADVNLNEVWDVVQHEVPGLKLQVEQILSGLP